MFGLIAGLLFAYDTYTIFLQIKSTRQHTAASTGGSATSHKPTTSERPHSASFHTNDMVFFFSSLQMTEFKRSKDAGASLTIAAGEPRGVCADANERVDQKGRWRVKIAGHSLIKATAQCEQTRGLFQGGV